MFDFEADKPLNSDFKCTLKFCGCRINPFIWISKKHKIIFLEIAKCGSSSLKKAFGINNLKEDVINAYYWQSISRANPRLISGSTNKLKKIKKNIEDLKLNHDLFLGIKRGPYDFQPYFMEIDLLKEKFPNFLYLANIRDPIKRFVSNFNMFSDDSQPNRKRSRVAVGKKVDSGIENLDFFIESTIDEPNHHFWPYSKFLNKIKDVDNKLIIDCSRMIIDWDRIKSKVNLPNFSSNAPYVYANKSKNSIRTNDLNKKQLSKIESIYKEDLNTFESFTKYNQVKDLIE